MRSSVVAGPVRSREATRAYRGAGVPEGLMVFSDGWVDRGICPRVIMEYVNIPGGVQDGSCIGDYVTECINPQDVQDYQGAGLTKGSDIIFMSRCGLPPKFLSVWLEGSGKEINLNESARRCANLFSAALEWGDHAIVMELFREGPHDGIAGGDINCYLDIIRCWSEAKARWVTAGSHASAKAISMHIKAGVTVREVDSPNGWVPFSDYGLEMLIALRNVSKPPR